MTTLAEALPAEMARVRDAILPAYLELQKLPDVNVGPVILMIRMSLDAAANALAAGDAVAMINALKDLREYTK